MEKHIYFVRHAESEANASGQDLGDTPGLSALGHAQATTLARRIAKINSIKTIVSSTLPRSLETAEIIAGFTKLPIEKSSLFDQRKRPSLLVGKSHLDPEAMNVMKEIFDGYVIPGHRHSDEENLTDLKHRTGDAIRFLENHPDDALCVVTHGMFLRALFVSVLSGGEFKGTDLQRAIEHLEPESTGVSYFRFESIPNPISGRNSPLWKIISWNDRSHLPA